MFQLSNPADVKVFRPRLPRLGEAGMMKRNALAATGVLVTPQSATVTKNAPGANGPHWDASMPSDVNGAAGLPRFGRSFPPRPSPRTSNPAMTVCGEPVLYVVIPEACQSRVTALRAHMNPFDVL